MRRVARRQEDHERIGKEADWVPDGEVKPPIPLGQRLFTLIDTGTLMVSLFTAEKPPSIALIAGREGSMLRVMFCHYERPTATLYKETVLRNGEQSGLVILSYLVWQYVLQLTSENYRTSVVGQSCLMGVQNTVSLLLPIGLL